MDDSHSLSYAYWTSEITVTGKARKNLMREAMAGELAGDAVKRG